MRALPTWICAVAGAIVAGLPLAARGDFVIYQTQGLSQVVIDNVDVGLDIDVQTNARSSSQVIHGGTSGRPAEARTAARSGITEMAANARLDSHFSFSNSTWFLLSSATFIVQLPVNGSTAQVASMDFHLPPGFVEVTSFVEIPDAELEATILATIRTNDGTRTSERFLFQDMLTASFNSFHHAVVAEGDSTLDLTPLENPVVVDQIGGGIRVTRIEFPDFTGHLDLGLIPRGEILTIEYEMQARVAGSPVFNIGIAAINDPFAVDTDPVQEFQPFSIETGPAAAVPEPSALMLLLLAIPLAPLVVRAGWLRSPFGTRGESARPNC